MRARLRIALLPFVVACAPELRLGELPGAASGAGGGGSSAAGGDALSGGGGAAGGGTAGAGAAAGGGSGGGGAGGLDCALDASCLTDDGLVVRYFLDEAATGSAPAQVEDAAAAPMPLALTYGPEMSFAADGAAHRGLSWTAAGADGRASALIDGTKIQSALQGTVAGTIEAVLRVAEVVEGGSRIVHIGMDAEGGRFTLRSETPGQIVLWWNGDFCGGAWDAELPERAVMHGVFDSTVQEPAADRVRLYINGAPARRRNSVGGYCGMHVSVPPLGTTLDFPDGRHLVLGNRELGGRTFSGALYYAALYARALTAAEIERHAAALLHGDDRPAP
ncbi:LamG-like jellyroll fold domain-containing protein [Sorangium sp. So ce542]|uniref:LamG-like jellyroll fold domain-containing protein n=1 Tax=Sorangium sp. So ce542 TaxID=3133316 RepID=UPI003F5E9D03